jgi:CheY-like chemotaxis protein
MAHVVVTEPYLPLRQFMHTLLRFHGHQVDVASPTLKALTPLRTAPDRSIVILDVSFPQATPDLVNALLIDPAFALHHAFILTSTSTLPAFVRPLVRLYPCLIKPFMTSVLLDAIDEAAVCVNTPIPPSALSSLSTP